MPMIVRTLVLACAAAAASPAARTQQAGDPAPRPEAPRDATFLPPGARVPTLVETPGFKLVPLGPALVDIDFAAYMSSVEHLQKSFTRSAAWPHAGISHAEALRDMETEQARFRARQSFAYAVLTPDGRRERGCVYISPSPVAGHDAVVRLWVTKAEYDAGFDAELYAWVRDWIGKDWPFRDVAYPGRAIDWQAWDAALAAATARNRRGE